MIILQTQSPSGEHVAVAVTKDKVLSGLQTVLVVDSKDCLCFLCLTVLLFRAISLYDYVTYPNLTSILCTQNPISTGIAQLAMCRNVGFHLEGLSKINETNVR